MMANGIQWWSLRIIITMLVLAIMALAAYLYVSTTYRQYLKERGRCLAEAPTVKPDLITEIDLAGLPSPIRKYLEYVGVVGTEKVSHFSIKADGYFRLNSDRDWAPVEAEQLSLITDPRRLFFIKMKLKGMKIAALHHYESAAASMVIKILDLFTVVNAHGMEMNQGETVTVFNDMCVLAPSTLIDSRITWKEIDEKTVVGTFTNSSISVMATLHFNEMGQLVDFISDDRYHWNNDGTYDLVQWSTPISEYGEINGLNLPIRAEAVWMHVDGPFPYAKFNLLDVTINPKPPE